MYFYTGRTLQVRQVAHGRNPCYNGRCISTVKWEGEIYEALRRNPCYNGRCISTLCL